MLEWSRNIGGRNNSGFTSPFTSPRTNLRNQIYNSMRYSSPKLPTASILGPEQLLLPPLLPPSCLNAKSPDGQYGSVVDLSQTPNDTSDTSANIDYRYSYYMSSYPLYCSDWTSIAQFNTECIALSSFKEGFNNELQILHGIHYGKDTTVSYENQEYPMNLSPTKSSFDDGTTEGFDFHKVCSLQVDYPITNLQWDPSINIVSNWRQERVAASSDALRIYKVDLDSYDTKGDYKIIQTHHLNNSANNGKNGSNSNMNEDIITCPPVTSFDWNKADRSVIITSSVDTTCTVWDLNRSISVTDNRGNKYDGAQVKTQLIAHDSEVFDVKFLKDSINLFASVGNDGSMRVFDLRNLEHSTIIYEPTASSSNIGNKLDNPSYSSKALIKLDTSKIDEHYLATIGVNSNQIIIIDTRMPGIPVAILDGSFGGTTNAAINCIKWHPNSNFLLSGGDDCQALVWDCNNLYQLTNSNQNQNKSEQSLIVGIPLMAYQDILEVNNVCWQGTNADWMGVVSGKGFQAVLI